MLVPSSINLKMKFPEFQDQDDATIEFAIEEAALSVDDTWLPSDQPVALMYLAAHYLMVSVQRQESAMGEVVSSERFGEMSITYKTPNQPMMASSEDFTTTSYGTRFMDLAKKNFPACLVI